MEPIAPDLQLSKPNWDVEKTRVSNILNTSYEVKPNSPDETSILVAAKDLYQHTRKNAQPFLDSQYEHLRDLYFKEVAGKAFSINTQMHPMQGDVLPRYEDLLENSTSAVIAKLADTYAQIEHLKTKGLAAVGEQADQKFKNLAETAPDFLGVIADFDFAIKEAKEQGGGGTKWLDGLIAIRANFHNQLHKLNAEGYPSRNTSEAVDRPLYTEKVNSEVKKLAMGLVDKFEYAFPSISKHEWIERFKRSQERAISFLENNGIARMLPKVGQEFDPKWQMATHGQGQRITKATRGAFIDKTNGKLIQDAQVEVGI